jgi:hypothetical protein
MAVTHPRHASISLFPQVIVFVALYSSSDLQLSTNQLRVASPGKGLTLRPNPYTSHPAVGVAVVDVGG